MGCCSAGLPKTVLVIFCLAAFLAPPSIAHALAPQSSFQERKQSLREIIDPKNKAIPVRNSKSDWPKGALHSRGMIYLSDSALQGAELEGPDFYGSSVVACTWRFVNGLLDSNPKFKGRKQELGEIVLETLKNSLWHGNRQDPGKGIWLSWDSREDTLALDVYDEGESVHVPGTIAPKDPAAGTLSGEGKGLVMIQEMMESYQTESIWDRHGRHIGTRVSMVPIIWSNTLRVPDGCPWL